MITNCDVPLAIAQLITIIVPVASTDVLNTPSKQWQTRMLYNAYLPFNYSYILDTHVFPCYNDSYSKVFSLFSESGVDVSASSRDGDRVYVSGGAVLSKWGAPSHSFWKEVYQRMLVCNGCDDQSAIQYVIERNQTHQWTYRWLSSNWFWASIGITEEGFFLGSARCYRSSVIATGPIMWIHGDPGECGLMNGQDGRNAYKKRVYFLRGNCNMTEKGPIVVFSKRMLSRLVTPYKPTHLNWVVDRDSDSLFWNL